MIPIAQGRPLLDFILSCLADAGLVDIGVVIGPEHDFVRHRYVHEIALSRIRVTFAIQAEPRGTADAVLAAKVFVGNDPFIVVNADNLYPIGALRRLADLPGPGLIGFDRAALIKESNIEPERVAKFALIWADADGHLTRIVEKPGAREATASSQISMNCWRFSPQIFTACEAIGPSARGELELQDAVTDAMARGEAFSVVPWSGGVLDLSSRADIESAADRLQGVEVRL